MNCSNEEPSPPSVPLPTDVLCGRGGGTNHHVGNNHWRALVSANKRLYISLPKKQKALVAKSIVHAIQSQYPPGRFLEKEEDGSWSNIGDRRAMEKTSQALREGAPEIRTEMKEKRTDATEPATIPGQLLPNGLITLNYSGVERVDRHDPKSEDGVVSSRKGGTSSTTPSNAVSAHEYSMMQAFQRFQAGIQDRSTSTSNVEITRSRASLPPSPTGAQPPTHPVPTSLHTTADTYELAVGLIVGEKTLEAQMNVILSEALRDMQNLHALRKRANDASIPSLLDQSRASHVLPELFHPMNVPSGSRNYDDWRTFLRQRMEIGHGANFRRITPATTDVASVTPLFSLAHKKMAELLNRQRSAGLVEGNRSMAAALGVMTPSMNAINEKMMTSKASEAGMKNSLDFLASAVGLTGRRNTSLPSFPVRDDGHSFYLFGSDDISRRNQVPQYETLIGKAGMGNADGILTSKALGERNNASRMDVSETGGDAAKPPSKRKRPSDCNVVDQQMKMGKTEGKRT